MQACAIIAEFNPFHNGHQYLIEQAKKLTNCDAVIVIMSGNFVQRGEPALVNKWERAKIAVQSGADLVVEIPTEYSTASAFDFARAGVLIARDLGVSQLVFGCETPELNFIEESKILDQEFDENQDYNQSFASQLFNEHPALQSNDILGINYAYWVKKIASNIDLVPVQRKKAAHLDDQINAEIASANAIRQSILAKSEDYKIAINAGMQQALANNQLVNWESLWDLLKYRILTITTDELSKIRSISEGFENRIVANINQATSFDDFIKSIKTKRFTYTRIQRMLIDIILNNNKKEFSLNKTRLLAANQSGRNFLRESALKEFVMTKVSQADYDSNYLFTKRADDVYQMVAPYEYGKAPIMLDNVK